MNDFIVEDRNPSWYGKEYYVIVLYLVVCMHRSKDKLLQYVTALNLRIVYYFLLELLVVRSETDIGNWLAITREILEIPAIIVRVSLFIEINSAILSQGKRKSK